MKRNILRDRVKYFFPKKELFFPERERYQRNFLTRAGNRVAVAVTKIVTCNSSHISS